ncbi:MAG: hypothetical protein ACPIOQ_23350, partial [Promethearchaeia archaeon]
MTSATGAQDAASSAKHLLHNILSNDILREDTFQDGQYYVDNCEHSQNHQIEMQQYSNQHNCLESFHD